MNIPLLLSGPMIRKATATEVTISLLTSTPLALEVKLLNSGCHYQQHQHEIRLGEHLYLVFYILTPTPDEYFNVDQLIPYQLHDKTSELDLSAYYLPGTDALSFVIPKVLNQVYHGSCRNPHHPSKDALTSASNHLAKARSKGELGATLLLMSGDQIYADDVAGPMLKAIHSLIKVLGIYREATLIAECEEDKNLYQRDTFLPKTPWQDRSKRDLGYWLKKDVPHFTSANATNHLVGLEEFIAMYVLVHSQQCWQLISSSCFEFETDDALLAKKFNQEKAALLTFSQDLKAVEQLFANISSLMMFDDHDVTDDWNLTALWEQGISSNAVSTRIIANGLIGYLLFQGIGNDGLSHTKQLFEQLKACCIEKTWQLKAIDKPIMAFNQWHYCIDAEPYIIVLDTRTQRWRNEHDFNEPSGLLDWEALCELESNLQNRAKAIIVSPAPVFGVKSIEAIQAVFNACGQPLVVDVENWMAHEGAARKLMMMFRREDTPVETILLSGDVHYSFCFSVKARFKQRDNRIWQLTASGIKNEFPKKLLAKLDVLDSVMYGRYSPLNYFTKRWQMKVNKHTLKNTNEHLISRSGISLITLTSGNLAQYQVLHSDGSVSDFKLD